MPSIARAESAPLSLSARVLTEWPFRKAGRTRLSGAPQETVRQGSRGYGKNHSARLRERVQAMPEARPHPGREPSRDRALRLSQPRRGERASWGARHRTPDTVQAEGPRGLRSASSAGLLGPYPRRRRRSDAATTSSGTACAGLAGGCGTRAAFQARRPPRRCRRRPCRCASAPRTLSAGELVIILVVPLGLRSAPA